MFLWVSILSHIFPRLQSSDVISQPQIGQCYLGLRLMLIRVGIVVKFRINPTLI